MEYEDTTTPVAEATETQSASLFKRMISFGTLVINKLT